MLLVLFILIFSLKEKNISSKVQLIPTQKQDFLESYFNNVSEYEESFSKYSNLPKAKVFATTTSHHFLAKDLIAQTFSGIDPKGVKTVIIVGPDHYNQISDLKYMAQTTDVQWRTPFGNMIADKQILDSLSPNKEINSDINLFRIEHSIYVLVPFIKKVFPDAKLVPLVLKQINDFQYFSNLGEQISKTVDVNSTLLVISSDFSHDSTIKTAIQNDQKSISLLPNINLRDINSITNDCKQCTAFLFGYLKNINTKFTLLFNKNSFDISGVNPDGVTSYVGIYYTPE